ncbi:MAG: putative 2-aminoethylphosphonate ABC transporter permease subunit [Oscillospiraceae bacterium]|jgi:iron(III) transport system permease protein|nr:putative 2-aminoethylphosphonate ABC transporter permease subunit [Oscillospiraceae bacterium]
MKNRLRQKFLRVSLPQAFALASCLAAFTATLVLPLFSLLKKAFLDPAGQFVGFANYLQYFKTPTLRASIGHTFFISIVTMAGSVALGFAYAYALTRTRVPGKTFFKYVALLPVFIPTIAHAIGLVYLLGRQGLITRLGLPVALYGPGGIILSELIFTFPQAFLMFYVALEFADGRLYEAAGVMGVGPLRRFFRITLPEVKFTLGSACFVCFTLAFTDFGAPKVIGGSYNVLATDIYKQVSGQFDMNMGAVVGTLLLIPAVLCFLGDRLFTSKNESALNARATKLNIKPSLARDSFFFLLCAAVTLCLLVLVAALCMGALVKFYPYDMNFTWKHFQFNASTGGIGSYFNSLKMSVWTAVLGAAFVFAVAYLLEKTNGLGFLRKYGRLLSVLPLALPGMVIGLSFIFFFNSKQNPLHFIYGSIIILVLSNILHYFSVPFLTASASLKKLDSEFENAAECLGAPRWKTFLRVSVPLCLPAILEIVMYYFVNSMVTVSAVVFLYSADFRIASIALTHMEEAGDISQAAAMSLLILGINLLARLAYEVTARGLRRKSQQKERL